MKATLRYLRVSPRKVQLVARAIKGLSVTRAEQHLNRLPKKAAKPLLKLLRSAAAGAHHNFGFSVDELEIKEVLVTQGPTYKRFRPRAFGRVFPIGKRTSHVTITLKSISEAIKRQTAVGKKAPIKPANKLKSKELKAQTSDKLKKGAPEKRSSQPKLRKRVKHQSQPSLPSQARQIFRRKSI